MRFYEFQTHKPRKPKKPRKPLTPEQSLVAAKKRQVDAAKQALQSVKDHQKQRKKLERIRALAFQSQKGKIHLRDLRRGTQIYLRR
jgi:hypothetical protein